MLSCWNESTNKWPKGTKPHGEMVGLKAGAKMSVKHRLEDAKLLWDNGRKDGALLEILIAAAATAKKRFPRKKDKNGFKELIRQITPTIYDSNFPPVIGGGGIKLVFGSDGSSNQLSLDEALYTYFRCNLVHEACMPKNVQFIEHKIIDGKEVDKIIVGTPLQLPESWILNLAKAVAEAPENINECRGLF